MIPPNKQACPQPFKLTCALPAPILIPGSMITPPPIHNYIIHTCRTEKIFTDLVESFPPTFPLIETAERDPGYRSAALFLHPRQNTFRCIHSVIFPLYNKNDVPIEMQQA